MRVGVGGESGDVAVCAPHPSHLQQPEVALPEGGGGDDLMGDKGERDGRGVGWWWGG